MGDEAVARGMWVAKKIRPSIDEKGGRISASEPGRGPSSSYHTPKCGFSRSILIDFLVTREDAGRLITIPPGCVTASIARSTPNLTNQLPGNARGHLHRKTGRARIRTRQRLGVASPKPASGGYIDW